MRFWNKSKKTREKTWSKVVISKSSTSAGGITRWVGFGTLKEWCQRQPGRGRFFIEANPPFADFTMDFNLNSISTGKMIAHFEKPEDAVIFSLSWG